MKGKYVLFGAVIFLVLAVLVIYWKRQDSPPFVVGAPPAQVSPTPCVVKDVGTNPPPHVCLIKCGSRFNDVSESLPNNTDVLCCPVGMAFGKTKDGQDTCVVP